MGGKRGLMCPWVNEGRAVTSVVISGSTALGAAQAILDPLSPAAGRCADLGDGYTESGHVGAF